MRGWKKDGVKMRIKTGIGYVFLTAALFATLEPVSKLIPETVHPVSMTFLRFLIGALLLLPSAVITMRKKHMKLTVKDWVIMAGLGILNICVSMVLLQYAVLTSSAPALIAIIFSCNSVITIFLSALFLKEKITIKKLTALLLCIIGILICSYKSLGSNAGRVSVLLAAGAAVAFSLYTVLSKKLMKQIDGAVQTGFSFFLGSMVLLLVLVLYMDVNPIEYITGSEIWILLYLGIGVTGIGYWSYFRALRKSSATTASLAFFIKPILAPFAAFFIVGAELSWEMGAALIFVVAGSYLAAYSEKRREES